jgi:hypothetical protein
MPLLFPICATCPTHLILLNFITRTILGEEISLCNFAYRGLPWVLYVILCDVCYCIVLCCTVMYCPVLHCSILPPGINPFAVNNNNNNNNNK